jgi:hypothetical protein
MRAEEFVEAFSRLSEKTWKEHLHLAAALLFDEKQKQALKITVYLDGEPAYFVELNPKGNGHAS